MTGSGRLHGTRQAWDFKAFNMPVLFPINPSASPLYNTICVANSGLVVAEMSVT
jgi:hypothetical protein